MKCDKKSMLLYAVTDRAWTGQQSLYSQIESALKGGVTCVQLREKQLNEDAFLKEAMEISLLCKQYKVPFIINDNLEIAIKCHADGVHVGQEDMSVSQVRKAVGDNMIIGVSAHSVEEALRAVDEGADYLGVGAMFSTGTKTNVKATSKETLRDICFAVNVPVVAIGGVNQNNISELENTGISGVALVSAIFAARDIEKQCRMLFKLTQKIVNSKK